MLQKLQKVLLSSFCANADELNGPDHIWQGSAGGSSRLCWLKWISWDYGHHVQGSPVFVASARQVDLGYGELMGLARLDHEVALIVLDNGAGDCAAEMSVPQSFQNHINQPVDGLAGLRTAGVWFDVVVIMHCAAAPSYL